MTQTRPANLFEDSPSDSPGESLLHSQSIPGSASVRMTQTQLDATQTPTQAPRGLARRPPLEMLESFIMPGTEVHISTAETEEEVEETQEQDVEEELEEEETEMSGDDLPSAGQHLPATQAATPVRTAFDVLQATQKALAAPPKAKKERARSDFVDAEAVRSDDEDMGMGAGSGDEDENGMDAELESLVDNEEVERDLLEKQDERAGEAYMCVLGAWTPRDGVLMLLFAGPIEQRTTLRLRRGSRASQTASSARSAPADSISATTSSTTTTRGASPRTGPTRRSS